MLVCLYEDRPQQVAGLKILLLSVDRFCPAWPVRLRFPGIDQSFRQWLQRFPQLTLVEERLGRSGSYDVKPSVLLDGLNALSAGAGDGNVDRNSEGAVLWMDTDIVVNGSLDFLAREPRETLIATQDPWDYTDGSTHRCESWGLKAARSLHGPLNSAVVRVTGFHRPLVERWQALLTSDIYLAEQSKPVHERHQHLLGDQDALGALLASAEFADIPVRRLRHAREILQHHGAGAYQIRQRWQVLRYGLPPMVHAMGTVKPWKMADRPHPTRQLRDYYERVYLELSPYLHLARQYRGALGEADSGWMETRTAAGRLGSMLSLGHPAFKGALQALLHRVISGHASGGNG